MSYDNASQVLGVYNLKSTGEVISSFDYSYDAAGNRTCVAESGGDRVTWSYDDTSQLINERRSGANSYNTTYVYDGLGNRLVEVASAGRTTSTYDLANQLKWSETTTGRTTYTFDADGNQQIVQEPTEDRTTNVWDYENQLIEVQNADGTRSTMTYNPDFRRVAKE